MVNLLDPLSLRPGGYLIIENRVTGEKQEFDTFTCCHCGRMVVKNPARVRPRTVCKRSMKLACDLPACATECRELLDVDSPLAHRDYLNQPWFLRDPEGYPLDRIFFPDGTHKDIRRKDNGTTTREMARSLATERTFTVSCAHCLGVFELNPGLPQETSTCKSCSRLRCEKSECFPCPSVPFLGRK